MRTILGIWMLVICAHVAHAAAPEIHVSVPQQGIDAAERAVHADALRAQTEALLREANIEVKSADVCVSKLSIVVGADKVTIKAEVRLVLSTKNDRILSLAAGTAMMSIEKREYRPEKTRELRGQVLAGALEGLGKRVRAAYKRVA